MARTRRGHVLSPKRQKRTFRLNRRSFVAIPYNQRTCDCGTLRSGDVGKEVILAGWVNNYRDHGQNLVFIDLRDRGGVTQCRF